MKIKVLLMGLSLFIVFPVSASGQQQAIFAGGCFWCMEPPFDKQKGVISTTSGYIGGSKEKANYEDVSAGKTGHFEAIKVIYDPKFVTYKQLLDIFWKNVDPFDGKGQFCDKGKQYLSAIFYGGESEKESALKSMQELKGKIETKILPASPFYAAEEYHQNYYTKNPVRYKYYRYSCGRDKRLEEIWEK